MGNFQPGDNVLAIRLANANAAAKAGMSEKGMMRPDARDVINNADNSLADPYNGQFPWVVPGLSAIQIHAQASVVAPAYGTQVLITSFQCPQAMEAVINMIVMEYDGSGYVPGSGSLTFTVDINRPLGATVQGYNPPGWGSITTQLGSTVPGDPFPIPAGIRLSERDTIRIKATTAASLGIGAPNYITGILLGWYYPVKLATPIRG